MSTADNPLTPPPEQPTQNLLPLLHEIRHAAQRLVDNDETTVIDLLAMPLSSGEREHLEALLGKGEVDCHLDALGKSTVQETAISGVWLIEHFNSNDELIAKSIEIATIPAILPAERKAIRSGLDNLDTLIKGNA